MSPALMATCVFVGVLLAFAGLQLYLRRRRRIQAKSHFEARRAELKAKVRPWPEQASETVQRYRRVMREKEKPKP